MASGLPWFVTSARVALTAARPMRLNRTLLRAPCSGDVPQGQLHPHAGGQGDGPGPAQPGQGLHMEPQVGNEMISSVGLRKGVATSAAHRVG